MLAISLAAVFILKCGIMLFQAGIPATNRIPIIPRVTISSISVKPSDFFV
jgi:hypothetical protein